MVNFVVKNKLANYKFLPSKNKTSGESNLQLEKLEIQIKALETVNKSR